MPTHLIKNKDHYTQVIERIRATKQTCSYHLKSHQDFYS